MNDERKLSEHFEFGKNWQDFLRGVNEEKVSFAVADIENFIGSGTLVGKCFVDIGCGSGLSSLAAYTLGASAIYSYDIDPKNTSNVVFLKERFQVPHDFPWIVKVASIVSDEDILELQRGDIVYAWGVLHHTGDMWTAMKNTATLVAEGGHLYLMLYRDAVLAYPWKVIKRTYVKSPALVKFLMRIIFSAAQIAGIMAKGKNPIKSIKNYGIKSRGMSWYTDVTDWIGGYPFEYTEAEQVVTFLRPLGFELVKISPPISKKGLGLFGTGSYQYLFSKVSNKTSGSEE